MFKLRSSKGFCISPSSFCFVFIWYVINLYAKRLRVWLSRVLWWWYHWYFLPFLYAEGTTYTQQSYKVSDVFPFKWINKKWKDGFSVTSMSTAGNRWGIVMSRNAGYSDQVQPLTPKPWFHTRKALWHLLYFFCRLLNLISFIQVKEFIEGGRMDTE